MKTNRLFLLLFAFLLKLTGISTAQALEIVIDRGVQHALPIAVVPFAWTQAEAPPEDVAKIVSQNLARSGRFETLPEGDMPARPKTFQEINFADWRRMGMENLVVGDIKQLGDGNYEVSFRLVDVYRSTQLTGYSIRTRRDQLRYTAHQISDIIFERLTGIPGAFATRIAYITVDQQNDKRMHRLEIADADGHNPQVLLESAEPLMSPRWSADGRRIAYVSFEDKNSAVYIQDVFTGQRRKVAANPGINSAPAWSPDGKRLALTLSKDGNPEIYILHIDSDLLQRITNNPAIDTEPVWSPDGKKIYFTSDRGGGPQIYTVDTSGGNPQRVTYDGTYNARATISPDGKMLATVRGGDGAFRIAVTDLQTGNSRVLTDAQLDESPSFAPNGSMIIYATITNRGSELAAVSVDGQIRQRLAMARGQVREPDWGPLQN
jgi:TolB protein